MSSVYISVGLTILYCLLQAAAPVILPPQIKALLRDGEDHYCYAAEAACGPSHWDGICNTGNHKHQSPIDIQIDPAKFPDNVMSLQLNSAYSTPFDSFYIENNGHSIQISLFGDDDDDEGLSRPVLTYVDGPKVEPYVFSQIHFHWGPGSREGSEHTINSTAFAMELHLVHYAAMYEGVEDAAEGTLDPDALSVIGVFVEVRSDCGRREVFLPFLEAVRSVLEAPGRDKVKVEQPFRLSSFLPGRMDFFSYEGSLTTPSCAEAVRWSVVQEPICITAAEIEVFRSVKTEDGGDLVSNHRPTQALGNRTVSFYRARTTSSVGDPSSAGLLGPRFWGTMCSILILVNATYFLVL